MVRVRVSFGLRKLDFGKMMGKENVSVGTKLAEEVRID